MEWRRWFESFEEQNPDWWKGDEPEEPDEPGEPTVEDKPKDRRVWMLRFDHAKRDPVEGWYYDLKQPRPHPLMDTQARYGTIDDIETGDRVADFSLNQTPYWEVNGVDPDRKRIYVTPIDPNPFTTGVGAGGKPLDQHDYDVHSGDYERSRVDDLLRRIQDKQVYDPSDVAYLLLGTVPVNMGPNGSQGGWYNSNDTYSNRGGKKGYDEKKIQAMDAATLRRMGFEVPARALTGSLRPGVWNDFVNGQTSYRSPSRDDDPDTYDTKLPGEDYGDPHKMAHFILTHPQKAIRHRNTEAMIDYYKGADRVPKNERGWMQDEERDAFHAGRYRRPELESLVREIARRLAEERPREYEVLKHDRHYLTREKFIHLAREMGWDDLLRLYEKAIDVENRRRVFDHYREKGDADSAFRMLDGEETAENMDIFLRSLIKTSPQKVLSWRDQNEGKIARALRDPAGHGYYAQNLRKTIDYIDQERNNPWFGKFTL